MHMIGSLENLLWRERNLAVIGILDAIINLFKEYINRLGDIDWFIPVTPLVCFEIGGCDFAISIDEMIE